MIHRNAVLEYLYQVELVSSSSPSTQLHNQQFISHPVRSTAWARVEEVELQIHLQLLLQHLKLSFPSPTEIPPTSPSVSIRLLHRTQRPAVSWLSSLPSFLRHSSVIVVDLSSSVSSPVWRISNRISLRIEPPQSFRQFLKFDVWAPFWPSISLWDSDLCGATVGPSRALPKLCPSMPCSVSNGV